MGILTRFRAICLNMAAWQTVHVNSTSNANEFWILHSIRLPMPLLLSLPLALIINKWPQKSRLDAYHIDIPCPISMVTEICHQNTCYVYANRMPKRPNQTAKTQVSKGQPWEFVRLAESGRCQGVSRQGVDREVCATTVDTGQKKKKKKRPSVQAASVLELSVVRSAQADRGQTENQRS